MVAPTPSPLVLSQESPRPAGLQRAVWGRDPAVLHVIRGMLPMYLVSAALLALATALGLLIPWRGALLIGYLTAAWIVPYTWARSGRTRHLADPQLTYPTLLLTIGAMVLAYSLLDKARGAPLLWLCPLLAEQMARLSPRRVLQAALTTIGLLGCALTTLWVLYPTSINPRQELLTFVMTVVMLPVCALVAREVQRTRVRQAMQRGELNHTLEQLKELSTHDALTGLGNRRHMMTLLEEETKRQRRANQAFCVALIDLDRFKLVNDTHGHAVGDAVLKQFATLVQSVLAPTDALARWGGEEFLLLLPQADTQQAADTLSTARQAVIEHDWGALAPGLRVTFSAGVARHERDAALNDTLESADQSLYRAKQAGRDCAFHQAVRLHGTARTATSAPAGQRASIAAPGPAPVEADPPLASSPTATARSQSLLQTVVTLVMGRTNEMRDRLRLSLLASSMYWCWIAMINGYGVPNGLVEPAFQHGLLVIDLIGALAFYPLIRSGLSARWHDPELSLLQIAWGSVAAMACYVAAPEMRASVLQAMCLIQIFGMVKIAPRECLLAGAAAIACTVAALPIVVAHENLSGGALQTELIKTALTCAVLAQLTRMSRQFSVVRQQVAHDQTELTQAVERLREMSIRDPLTGLYNRRHLLERLAREHQRSVHLGRPLCVAMIDLDHFKRINDTHGHGVGDEVLVGFAQALGAVMRESDVTSRWGGEEFLVLLPDTGPGQASAALERLRKHLASRQLAADAPQLRVTLSAGIATYLPGETLEQAIERADRALYAAKSEGRDRCLLAA